MIAVVDFGSQVAHLICRRVRELRVYAEIVPYTISAKALAEMKPEGIILSGGPASVYGRGSPGIDPQILELGIPVLGICYGHQLIAKTVGGDVRPGTREYGRESLGIDTSASIFAGMDTTEQVWMSHGDAVLKLPAAFKTLASTKTCPIAAFSNEKKKLYGVQFHPEVQHTTNGKKLLSNFLNVCNATRDYVVANLEGELIRRIRDIVGDESVIIGVSGGVDSLVASVLIRKATPNVHCVYVDHGLVRKNETDEVRALYKRLGFDKFYVEDASALFLRKLAGVSDPEQKRKIIGAAFIEVFDRKVKELAREKKITFLGQGTIYPDRIESAQASGSASKIKTHHNVGGLPEKMNLKLVEPLADLYKDEVRELGMQLGLRREDVFRHPFPGPGLAVRILGEITKERVDIVREADHIFITALKESGQYDNVWQALAALLPVRAVGVMGDARTYGYIIALRAITSVDAMTADWAKLPPELLERVANDIIARVPGVTRVVYDISQKPPATIEFE